MSIIPIDEFISIHQLRFHICRWSPTRAEPTMPPIVLLHGLASATRIWDFVAPLLAEQGYEVVALDQRGHGESDKPDDGYDFATIVADDAAVFAGLGVLNPVLVGHSWGAMVALQYAATFPRQVRSLVLVDGATNQLSLRPGWSREQAMIDLAPPRFAGTPRETFLAFFKRGPLGQQWSPALEDSILHIVQLRDDDTVAPRLSFEHHLQIIGAMWDQPTFSLYQQVRCPVKLVVAEQPDVPAERAEFMRQRRMGIAEIQRINSRVQVVTLPDTIHDIPLQRPERLAEEIKTTVGA
jgi:pimeloyl-ACP methyl ester carboxylesterase